MVEHIYRVKKKKKLSRISQLIGLRSLSTS